MKRGLIKKMILHILNMRGPLHVYGIIKSIEEETLSIYRPSTGVIYPALDGLIHDGLVSVKTIEGRKIYSITEKGKIAISLDEPLNEHIKKYVSKDAPYKELYEIFRTIISNWKNLTPSEKKEVRNIIREFSNKIMEVIRD